MEAVVILKLRFGLGEERHSKHPLYEFPRERGSTGSLLTKNDSRAMLRTPEERSSFSADTRWR